MGFLRTLVLAALAITGPLPASAQNPPARACQAAEHRQFDFWIGEWEVFLPTSKKAGENRIEAIAAGCALLEHWSGSGGFSGKSLNTYDAATRRWHQTWVDSSGGLLVLDGAWADGRMVLSADGVDAAGKPIRQRIAWSPNADGSVRQLWESSSDAGTTWTTVFDGRYVRRR
jgi:hypothetical protein